MKENWDIIVLFIACLIISAVLSELQRADASTGSILYKNRCASCHNVNPTKTGSIGPDLAGSSLELITLKTQERKYPVGYKPKRKTRVMPKIPLSKTQIKSLHDYINGFSRKK
jgi:cytochrome c553